MGIAFADQEKLTTGAPAAAPASGVFIDIDLDTDGRQAGHVRIAHSPHHDAWGAEMIPIVSIRNGAGPTILIEAGNHGDEYEGQIALANLARTTDPRSIRGQIILLPAVNAPAVRAAQRCSPVDGLNFNRAFPGHPLGTLSQQIAHCLSATLMPRAQYFLDLHSGGSSLSILPSAIVETARDPAATAANFRAACAFGADTVVFVNNLGEPRTATATASRLGLVTVGTELRGGGGVDNAALAMCERGIRNILAHAGIAATGQAGASAPRVLSVAEAGAYHLAPKTGVLQHLVGLGQPVARDEPLALIHDPFAPFEPPLELRSQLSGVVFALRHPAGVAPGNCCAVIATEGAETAGLL
ncbi:MAG: succinylglutamate desuccinylase/aspartoacylase family protein [Rhodobacteraceae bacterium]|nr:succinylglutamate desuccinylase/aspartoacylase family protein [Paracoccaceae bacterium]